MSCSQPTSPCVEKNLDSGLLRLVDTGISRVMVGKQTGHIQTRNKAQGFGFLSSGAN